MKRTGKAAKWFPCGDKRQTMPVRLSKHAEATTAGRGWTHPAD